jgi:magnesium chelatase family protein
MWYNYFIMSFAKVFSAQTVLLKPHIINIEIDLSKGLYAFSLIGLASKEVDEAKDRVGAAIKNSGFTSPKQKNQNIVVSLAPADIKKEGPLFDVPIALSYLLASNDIRFNPEEKLFIGELALDGSVRPVRGVLPIVKFAKDQNFSEVYVPLENADEALLVEGIDIYGISNLKELIDHLNERNIDLDDEGTEEDFVNKKLSPLLRNKNDLLKGENILEIDVDFSDVKGNETAKRGLEIAAAGGHNISMWGPPGTGKTMLARAFRHLLPELSLDDQLEVTSIHSVAGALHSALVRVPPFRAPHHTASYVSLVGGGATPKPGEVTLAHKGVLFLDEFPEFETRVIDALRQPLEDRVVTVSRAKGTAQFPAQFILVAAMNPCPCGNFQSREKECICSPIVISRYQRKISGPIVDRIDMWVEVSQVKHGELMEKANGETTEDVRRRVVKARALQKERFTNKGLKINTNSEMNSKNVIACANLSASAKKILDMSANKIGLSARGYHRVVKLGRTIADLAQSNEISDPHILEALQYRPKSFSSF